MLGKNNQNGISLGDYIAQLLTYENSFRTFPLEKMEIEILNKREVIS
jgi:hypothetical protein